MPLLIVDAVALGGVFYFYMLWNKRPIKFCCSECDALILSNRPWVCGVCGTKNTDTINFPFVYKCKNQDCGNEPKAYRCHHCEEFIFLTEDRDTLNFAYSLNSPADVPKPDAHADKLKGLRQKKEIKTEQREVAIVQQDLDIIKKRKNAGNEKKPNAKDAVQKDVDYIMELELAEVELMSKYQEQFKDNPQMLKRMKAALKASIQSKKSEHM